MTLYILLTATHIHTPTANTTSIKYKRQHPEIYSKEVYLQNLSQATS